MDEENKSYSDALDEIIRLQAEINKDISKISKINPSAPNLDGEELSKPIHEEGAAPPSESVLDYSKLEPVAETSATFSPAELRADSMPPISEFPSDYGSYNQSGFYTETVRDDRTKYKKGRFKKAAALVAIAGVCLGVGIGAGFAFLSPIANRLNNNNSNYVPQEFKFDEPMNAVLEAQKLPSEEGYADLIEIIEPSVVSIYSKMDNVRGFYDFSNPSMSSGSGIIFHEDEQKCYIATNAHVINGMNEVSISVSSAELVPAKLVGKDVYADLAVISILKSDLRNVGINKVTISGFGDSEGMRVGDVVLAIGNALGEGNTATNGILSAKDKEITTEGSLRSLQVIQTNAAINPGNSGGPLINTKGEIIGITTAKAFETKVEGMGYAIPSNIAKPILEDLMNSTTKPKLGITVTTMTEEMAKQLNLPTAGALVESVIENSPAQKAGIKQYDIITGIAGNPVFSTEDIVSALKGLKIGDVVEIKLIRSGKEFITVNVTLDAIQNDDF